MTLIDSHGFINGIGEESARQFADRAIQLALAVGLGYLAYRAYRSMNKPRGRRKVSSRKSKFKGEIYPQYARKKTSKKFSMRLKHFGKAR